MRGEFAVAALIVGFTAATQKALDQLLPCCPNPAEHWREEVEGEAWVIESTQKALQADRNKLDRVLERRDARLQEEQLRWESVGYDRDGSRSMAQISLEWEVQHLRSKIDTSEKLVRRSCSDYRDYAQKLADEEPEPPMTAPAACNSF